MSASEQELPDSLSSPSRKRNVTRSGRLGLWVPLVTILAVVVVLMAVLGARAGVTASQSGSSGGASLRWQTYHDPFGLSSLQLPPGWTAHVEPASTWYIDSTGSEKVSEEMVTLSDLSQGTGSAYFRIVADPIKTAFDRQYYCRNSSTLHGFSSRNLSSMEQSGGVWLFTTENATFQINIAIPGIVVPAKFGAPTTKPTPLPATWSVTDKMDVNAMLVSFQPTDPKPLAC